MTSPYWFKQTKYIISKPTPVLSAKEEGSKKMEPNILVIQSLGIKAPIIEVVNKKESDFQKALTQGVGHYPGTASIGDYGNTYLFGHSSDHLWKSGSYKTVFALLPHINIGDKIIASDNKGNSFTYIVTETKVASADDFSVLDQHGNQKKILTIQTSYPIGTSLKRFIVTAEIQP
ncbi:MAG: sortase [Patescibacteria group bacterium]